MSDDDVTSQNLLMSLETSKEHKRESEEKQIISMIHVFIILIYKFIYNFSLKY